MTRFIAFLLFLMSSPAWAGVPCTLPFNLLNGTTADASQVMANYNALVSCLGNAATAGANSDITSLNGLTTPIPRTAGGTTVFIGGSSSGPVNAQTIVSTTPTFILQAGSIVTYVAGLTNTGPLQINVQGTGLKSVFRQSQFGASNSVGGETIVNQQIIREYDGTEYQCVSCGQIMVGEVRNYAGNTAPPGWLALDGSCVSQTPYVDLYNTIATAYGSCGAGLFALPDGRGRAIAGLDNQGVNGATTRMSSCSPNNTNAGGVCGQQNEAILQANLPSLSLSVASITIAISGGTSNVCNSGTCTIGNNAFFTTAQTPAQANILTDASTTPVPYSFTFGGSVPLGGSGTALPTVQPTAFIWSIIKL